MLDLERSQVISSIKKMDRQGLREISLSRQEEVELEEEEEEEEEEDPLPVYNPHGDSEDVAVTDDVSYQDTDSETGPYYDTTPDSEEQYPVAQQ